MSPGDVTPVEDVPVSVTSVVTGSVVVVFCALTLISFQNSRIDSNALSSDVSLTPSPLDSAAVLSSRYLLLVVVYSGHSLG